MRNLEGTTHSPTQGDTNMTEKEPIKPAFIATYTDEDEQQTRCELIVADSILHAIEEVADEVKSFAGVSLTKCNIEIDHFTGEFTWLGSIFKIDIKSSGKMVCSRWPPKLCAHEGCDKIALPGFLHCDPSIEKDCINSIGIHPNYTEESE
jgi:hypothetical protein